jgi:hypothetical protein
MSEDKKENLVTKAFDLLKKDKVCSVAILMAGAAIAPHGADWLYKVLVLIVTGSEAVAATLGGK